MGEPACLNAYTRAKMNIRTVILVYACLQRNPIGNQMTWEMFVRIWYVERIFIIALPLDIGKKLVEEEL